MTEIEGENGHYGNLCPKCRSYHTCRKSTKRKEINFILEMLVCSDFVSESGVK